MYGGRFATDSIYRGGAISTGYVINWEGTPGDLIRAVTEEVSELQIPLWVVSFGVDVLASNARKKRKEEEEKKLQTRGKGLRKVFPGDLSRYCCCRRRGLSRGVAR